MSFRFPLSRRSSVYLFSVLLIFILALLFLLTLLKKPALTVARVIDGDTLVLSDSRHLRLINFNAPEKGECGAEAATARLIELTTVPAPSLFFRSLGLRSPVVRVEADRSPLDLYGRSLGYLFVGHTFINELLLKEGLGEFLVDVNNKKYEKTMIAAAEAARLDRLGKWAACAPPAGGPATGSCLVKGNNDRNDKRYYHLPGFRHYEQTTIRLDLGDRWFCTEAAAVKAGFTPARD